MIELRAMTLADVRRVHEIDNASFSAPWPATAFTIELANPRTRAWVCESENKIVGFIVCWIIIDECHIATIAVDEAYRGKGIAKALLRKALKSGADEGAIISHLEVRASNEAAKMLYDSFGFELVGVRKKYYKDNNEDALLLTLEMRS